MSLPRPKKPIQMDRQKRKRIHRESKFADNNKDLPFTFSKPKKPRSESFYYFCSECGHKFSIGKNTCVVICGFCKNLIRVKEDIKILK